MELLLSTWIWEFLGRLHPMLVHFPIGLLIGAFFLEAWQLIRKENNLHPGINAFVYLGAVTAGLSAIMGWLLQSNEGYSGSLVDNHRVAGIITSILAVITAFIIARRKYIPRQIPFLMLTFNLIGITIVGHLGASLTHGEHYLTEVLPLDNEEVPEIDYGAQLATYQAYKAADSFPQAQLERLNLEVRAIFAHNCYQCHSMEKRKGDLALDHKEGVMAGGEHGPVIEVGNAAESEIMRRLHLPREDEESMPPKGKTLKKEEIALIELWIDQGAYWSDSALKVFREAELALKEPPLPAPTQDITHPIDLIVNDYFQDKNITWPDPVDDRTFIRRVYLDVVGLLPEPEEVNSFIEDASLDKREALIDQLLEDKHNYTQHWFSFWNDLLRNDYTGPGFITNGRKQISDWLYQSLWENKSYQQMVAELVNPTPESEGFIQGIKWRGAVNSSQTVEMQAAQNISQSLLGLNLKCASCHNSFVNNLTLDQAYGFANVFSDSTLEIFRCDKPTGRMAQTSFLYPQLGVLEGEELTGRLERLEELMTTPENGRVYRTVVNRYWDLLLGRGIVMPVDEMDNIPWSQTLLDWLAMDMINHGYDLKHLLKTILTSKTYQLPTVEYTSVEEILTDNFVFRGPAPRRITAEQFADVLTQIVAPVYHSVSYDPTHSSMPAAWIWHRERELDRDVLPKPGKRYFRYSFNTESDKHIASAELLLSVDHAFKLFLNDKEVEEGYDWRVIVRKELGEYLNAGSNIIAIEGENEGTVPNPAGILLSIQITYEDGTIQQVISNNDWKTTDQLPEEDWTSPEFDDEHWAQAKRVGSYERSYWGKILGFSHDQQESLAFARASLVSRDPFQTALGRPTRENVATQRNDQATLLQALELTNGTFFHNILQRGASQWLQHYGEEPQKLVDQLYLHFLGRYPTEKEASLLLESLGEQPDERAVEDVLWAMVLLPEFQLIY